jgi:DNA polymerase III epsilon subunit-like protein
MATKHIVLDFETLGNRPDTAVLSLGAVFFDVNGIIKQKEWFFQVQGQLENNRSVTADTIAWWMNQGGKAKTVFERSKTEGITIRDFIPQFLEFANFKGVRAWGNGATFDISIIENIFHQTRSKLPWQYYHARCYRTMKPLFKSQKEFEGVKHNALDDAIFQAKNLIEFFKIMPEADQ